MTPAIATVGAMYAAFMVVGWLASRKARHGTAADLIVAGRQMPLWIAALTMTATWVDGGYLLGTTEGAYKSSIQLGIQGGLCFPIIVMWTRRALRSVSGRRPRPRSPMCARRSCEP